jgi:type IV secretory pathway VirJ component
VCVGKNIEHNESRKDCRANCIFFSVSKKDHCNSLKEQEKDSKILEMTERLNEMGASLGNEKKENQRMVEEISKVK